MFNGLALAGNENSVIDSPFAGCGHAIGAATLKGTAASRTEANLGQAFVIDAVRTPRGRGRAGGALHLVSPARLAAQALCALPKRNGLDPAAVEDVILGCVTNVGEQGGCIARSAAILAGYGHQTPGVQVNRFCASGLEAVNLAAAQIQAGMGDIYVAGGIESMSRVPMGSDGFPMAVDPHLARRFGFVPQGVSADLIATRHGMSRTDCDAYAVRSHQAAARAWTENRFERSILPVEDPPGFPALDRDEQIRPDTSPEGLAALQPSFREIGETLPGFDAICRMRYPDIEHVDHVHHAGNSSGISDGAAAVLLASESAAQREGLRPRARIRAVSRVGSEPTIMLTGPIAATERVLTQAGMRLSDIDLFEVNEAFAAVALLYLQRFDLDPDRVNPNGGAIAMGHPIGATGAMLLGTALDELERRGAGVALITLCVGGGMGVATIIERV